MVLLTAQRKPVLCVSKNGEEKEVTHGDYVKTVEEESIECEINKKRKKWTPRKLQKEFTKQKHDLVCLSRYRYHPFKVVCQNGFSFLQPGESYYTCNHKMQKRNYKLIFENLCSSPSIQISFCGILMTAIAALVDLKKRRL
ncbi:conserved Plasmodium protein, unknown function [Plasmodium knowlesi strain H]|uniref:Uncharacterized protein n=2 Tax=Plasmodium knowlesi (strain H) TaxID=5851 RepID=A0A5E7X314_PLAKH|nr:conserved Plasmodium protein, unknown function [Plasmodium knowlesi strain H]CAA9989230.1 conserved Plasmodium protein, unknown function [Plasmodium knowlesi strain H]SBO26211.1 conserved Plasmodium protein, unknown function [Plasmodium knowlesi strain H]SBO27136.1 conserved Plasmodium protein, unknown function [Plasmodium knowlesi strain H]VVS78704.1 conserved Plasmodium protein, unknown function [Plasmodium knowlesi strain H]